MSQKDKGKQPKKVKLDHTMVPKEWKDAVQRRAIDQNVTEDEIIRYGLHHSFKKEREDKTEKEELKALRKEARDLQKENEKTLKSILKELKKGGKP